MSYELLVDQLYNVVQKCSCLNSALLRPGTLHNEPQYVLAPVPPVNKFTWRNEPKHIVRSRRSTIRPRVGRGGFTYIHTEGAVGATVS